MSELMGDWIKVDEIVESLGSWEFGRGVQHYWAW